MSAPNPISMETFEDAIHSWFVDATDLNTIWGQKSAPRPSYPYGRLIITSGPIAASPFWDVRNTTDLSRPAGEEVEQEAAVPCTFVISCQVFVGMPDGRNPTKDARFYMNQAFGSLGLPSKLATLYESNVSFVRSEPVQNLSSTIGSGFVERAGLDVTFGASLSVAEYVGYIKTVHATSTGLGIDGTFGDI